MTREQARRILSEMERLRIDADEADTKAEERRLVREYGRLWRAVEPYVTGARPYSDETATPKGGQVI